MSTSPVSIQYTFFQKQLTNACAMENSSQFFQFSTHVIYVVGRKD